MERGQLALGSVRERRSGGEVWVIAGRRSMTAEFQLECERILADPTNQVTMSSVPSRPTGSFLWIHRGDTQQQIIDIPMPIRPSG
jgi:hypothetical protein